jgi:hypothetical protein
VDISGDDVQDCIAQSLVDGYGEINTGEGSYLLTATLRCLGLGVRPGGSVALLRSGVTEQASIVFHQAGQGRPVPPDARNTAVVRGWPGLAWAESARVVTFPDPSPPTDWPANVALRAIGVARDGHPDEATAIGLDLRRRPFPVDRATPMPPATTHAIPATGSVDLRRPPDRIGGRLARRRSPAPSRR